MNNPATTREWIGRHSAKPAETSDRLVQLAGGGRYDRTFRQKDRPWLGRLG